MLQLRDKPSVSPASVGSGFRGIPITRILGRPARADTPQHLLARHFFRRFLDNDLVSPDGETQASLALILAFLAIPGLWTLVGLTFSYGNPFLTPSDRLLMALGHKYQFIACSMIVMALATVLQWDALSLDARDLAILGPLPIPRGTLLGAKVAALLAFVSIFALAVNGLPTLGFPFVWLSLVPIGLSSAIRIVLVHALTTLGAAVFAFFAVVGVRSLLLLLCGPRLFRRVSMAAQFALVLALVTLFLLLPAISATVRPALARPTAATYLSPPMWFLGLYERLTAPDLLANPRLLGSSAWTFWQFDSERKSRRSYLEMQPPLDDLAGIAVVVFAAVLLAAALLYVAAYFRQAGRLGEAFVTDTGRPGPLRRAASRVATRVLVRDPVERAAFFFTLQTLGRSPKHLVYVAGYLAAGFALIVVTLASSFARSGFRALAAPTPTLLAVQLVVLWLLLVALRAVLAIPAELRANWVFRITEAADARRVAAGVRRAMQFAVALPLLVLFLPLHALLWGWTIAVFHLAVGALLALILIEALLLRFRKVPFACSYIAGKANLKIRWPFYLLAFLCCTYLVAWLEHATLREARPSPAILMPLAIILGMLTLWRVLGNRRRAALVFEEEPETATQALNL